MDQPHCRNGWIYSIDTYNNRSSFSSGILERAREKGDTWMKVPIRLRIGPLQLAIDVVQNCHAGEQQKAYIVLNGNFLCLSCPRATFALQYSGFVPREWQAAKGLFHHFSRLRDSKNERIRRARDTWKEGRFFRKQTTESATSSPSFS